MCEETKLPYIEMIKLDNLKLRPIVAGPANETHRLSSFLDLLLKPFLKHIPSYIRDDIDFLQHLPQSVEEDTVLVTLDVVGLYSNIPHDFGTSGNVVQILTNWFEVKVRDQGEVYQYHVDYCPSVDSKEVRVGMLLKHEAMQGRTNAFDGMTLFTPQKLSQEVTELVCERNTDGARIQITVNLVAQIMPNDPLCIRVWGIIFKRILQKINVNETIDVPKHGLQVLPSFVTSLLLSETLLLNVDLCHRIISTKSVLDIMYQIYEEQKLDQFHDKCLQELIGTIIITRYNGRTYRIDDINWEAHPTDKFQLNDGTETTFIAYYKRHHKMEIGNDKQPMLVSLPKKKDIRRGQTLPIMLVPELCYTTGLSPGVRADFRIMRDLQTHTRLGPVDRVATLQRFHQSFSRPDICEIMNLWGLELGPELLTVEGRVLPREIVFTSNKQQLSVSADQEWVRSSSRSVLLQPLSLYKWLVISSKTNASNSHNLISLLQRVCPPLGIQIGLPLMCALPSDRNECYMKAMKEEVNSATQIVICVVPTHRKNLYDLIKKFCCVERPVPSQVIVGHTISKLNSLSVATKVAIQINCKLGGEVWCLNIPLSGLMVIGVDTYHDASKKSCSVVGVVASINGNMTRYYSRVFFQQCHQEIADALCVPIVGALKKFQEYNGTTPDRIIVFRDGVSNGQLPVLMDHEVPQIVSTLQTYNIDKSAVVVVKKRIGARFFNKVGRGPVNSCPGTVIDKVVTRPEWYDFYLVSQSVRQGTVTPTHYNVIWDRTGLKPDHMQRLAYKLTHLYYNWPGTIRVPAPCQYAHKLAFLVGESIHKEPSLELSDLLFYL
ncbi:hypothetical protein ScPMuIL_007228 [Solemya velum]